MCYWDRNGRPRCQQSIAADGASGDVDRRIATVFELRMYTAAPGKMEALQQRFCEHTFRLFAEHEIQSIGYWTEVDAEAKERLYYLISYPDRKSCESHHNIF